MDDHFGAGFGGPPPPHGAATGMFAGEVMTDSAKAKTMDPEGKKMDVPVQGKLSRKRLCCACAVRLTEGRTCKS